MTAMISKVHLHSSTQYAAYPTLSKNQMKGSYYRNNTPTHTLSPHESELKRQ